MSDEWKKHYRRWASFAALDREMKELLTILKEDEVALEDCFYKNIEFGTGGMRGERGPGINRINVYTVRKASEGLARYLIEQGIEAKERGVVIAYDTRHKSHEFAFEAAKVLGKHGIRVYVFDILCPTPLLSFAVRHLGASAGIVITASHNPPEYNGYKVYGPDGAQITLSIAQQLMTKINEVDDELEIDLSDELTLKKNGLLKLIGTKLMEVYLEQIKNLRVQSGKASLTADQIRIVFTPLHGTTMEAITRGLKSFGYPNVTVVQEQAKPDPDFSTVASPNPEEHQAFTLAIQYAKEVDADLILGTDPDGDRLGVAVKWLDGEYTVLTGNQTGALLLHYMLSHKQRIGLLPKNGAVLKTIVTSELGRAIAADFGMATIDTLTGFKYIGEKIGTYEITKEYSFQFGYEESNGYLLGDFVRDKDAVQTALIIADVCAFYKTQGKTIHDALLQLFETYGFYDEGLHSLTFKGKEGMKKIRNIMTLFRSRPLTEMSGKKVIAIEDYLAGTRKEMQTGIIVPLSLPTSDVVKVQLEGESWFCVRPSGTEPKLKIYFGVKGDSLEDGKQKLAHIRQFVLNYIETA
ncbi:phospho-sugar mutase [Brevibacillus sp. NRS-1366]|uniref:phospho-sugar mutase n=1 Tax=Brevibacillus sp. NRS-1366 TaxID=3233899 RepID=UPI003D219240